MTRIGISRRTGPGCRGVWVQGDWARIDPDGFWYISGRSDDTIKVAGKRIGPAEVESAAVAHALVVEALAVGVPDEVKGEVIVLFAVVRDSANATEDLAAAVGRTVVDGLGKSFKPAAVYLVPRSRRRATERCCAAWREPPTSGLTRATPPPSRIPQPESIRALRG